MNVAAVGHMKSGERAAMKLSATVRQIFDTLIRMLTETDTTLAEFGSSTTLMTLGALLSLPTQALVATVPLFVTMKAVMPEYAWGGCFMALGLFQAMVNLTRSRRGRRYAAFVAAAFFGFIGLLGVSVTPVSLLGAVLEVHALVQGLVYLHLGIRGEG